MNRHVFPLYFEEERVAMSNRVPVSLHVVPEIVIRPDSRGAAGFNGGQITTRTVYDNYTQYSAMVIPSDGMPIRLKQSRALPRTQEQRDHDRNFRKDEMERCIVITVTKTFPNFASLESHHDVLKYYSEEHGLSDRAMVRMLDRLGDYVENNRPFLTAPRDVPYVVESTYMINVGLVDKNHQRIYLPDLATIVAISSVDFNSNFPTHPVHWVEPPAPPDLSKEDKLRDDVKYYDAKIFVVDNAQRRDKRFIHILGQTVELASNQSPGMQDGVYIDIVDSCRGNYAPYRTRHDIDEAVELFNITAEKDLAAYRADPELRIKDEKLRHDQEKLDAERLKIEEERRIREEQRRENQAAAQRKADMDAKAFKSSERKETADILSSVIKIAAGVTAAVVSVFTMFRIAS